MGKPLINYNKDGRKLVNKGPRDQQRRLDQLYQPGEVSADNSGIVTELKRQIMELKIELSNKTQVPKDMFSTDRLNEEVNKAVESTIKELTSAHSIEVKYLKEEINRLKIENKELKDQYIKTMSDINELRSKSIDDRLLSVLNSMNTTDKVSNSRPKMENVIIDPLENGAGKGLEPHIKTDEIRQAGTEALSDKLDKLKKLNLKF